MAQEIIETTEHQFYATLDNDNNVIGFTQKENNHPWFKDADRQPKKDIQDENGIYTHHIVDGKVEAKSPEELKDEHLSTIKLSVIKQLSVKTTAKLHAGTVDYNDMTLHTTEHAYANFNELSTLISNGTFDEELASMTALYMGLPTITPEDVKAISALFGKYKLPLLIAHRDTEKTILESGDADTINEILANY